ncbi:cupin-like domain-containing protein [Marinobacter lipolyticus]|uniref:cupin-like domain-containing protein n=1 Tax=Marinobacter lipolyticus TaxID=209639 RepID=UPI003A911CD7
MIQFKPFPYHRGDLGKEPTIVAHDCHTEELCSNVNLSRLLEAVPHEKIKTKTPSQKWQEAFNTHKISAPELVELFENDDSDCWIVLHEIEDTPMLRHLFLEMAAALSSSLLPTYGRVKLCTGSLFISRGAATTPYHMDYGSNLLLQLRGKKRFLAFSPNDPELVSKQSLREFFGGEANPPSLQYDPSFEQKALILNLEPGLGIYMPSTSPHCTETRNHDLCVTVSLSFVNPLADQLRRTSLFDLKLPHLRFAPDGLKNGLVTCYEAFRQARGNYRPRHKSFKPMTPPLTY